MISGLSTDGEIQLIRDIPICSSGATCPISIREFFSTGMRKQICIEKCAVGKMKKEDEGYNKLL
jgi:hypothetical protein